MKFGVTDGTGHLGPRSWLGGILGTTVILFIVN